MSTPLSRLLTRSAYAATQLPRIAWFVGHGLAMRQLSAWARQSTGETTQTRAHTKLPVPDRRRIYADMARLLRRDLANVEAGIYPLPTDHDGSLVTLFDRSRLFFEDLPEIQSRRHRRAFRELSGEEISGKRPDYYLQNFHFQSGGWMTEDWQSDMIRRLRYCSMGPQTRRDDRRSCRCMRSSPVAISVG